MNILNDDKLVRIKNIIQEEFSKSKTLGLAVGIFDDKQLIYGEGFGVSNLETQIPVNIDTTFMYGSITKLLSVIAFMQQWEKGKFSLDDTVNDYLPKGKIITKKGWPEITFRHILTHTSGIGELRKFTDLFKKGYRLITYDEQDIPPLSSLHELPIYASSPAGLRYVYSNIGISLTGFLVETFTGLDFRDYILDNILNPLEMKRSDLIRSSRVMTNEAVGYKLKKNEYIHARRWNNIIKPSGSLVSNIEDMAKFGNMLLNKGILNGTRILKSETFDLVWTPHYYSHEALKENYSLGLVYRLYKFNGKKVIGHTGGVNGFNACFLFIPDDKVGFIATCNLQEGMYNRTTLRIRNRLIKILSEAECKFVQDVVPNKSYWPKIKGVYGGYPGFLSNFRTIMEGIEFKITEKEDKLRISGLIGSQKKGEYLHPTKDPLIYELSYSEGESLYYNEKYVFKTNEEGNIIELARGFARLRKLRTYQTFRFKIKMITSLSILFILFVIFSLLLF